MSIAILDASPIDNASVEAPQKNIATCTEELAALRYLVILNARWASSDSLERERRKELRRELARLRRRYSDKIDEIAMTFGIQPAMDAKTNVERHVTVPRGVNPPASACEEDTELYF